MTTLKLFKRRVRARMSKTRESYATARPPDPGLKSFLEATDV